MTNNNYSKLVERYLDGEMSPSESLEFEQHLSKDPMLSSEYNFQRDIVDGIKDYRKTQLKTRLDSIDITPGLFETLATNTAVQATSGVLLTGAIAFGSYLLINSPEKAETIEFDLHSKSSELTESTYHDKEIEKLPLMELPSYDRTAKSDQIDIAAVEEEATPDEIVSTPITPDVVAPTLADKGNTEDILPKVEEIEKITAISQSKDGQIEVENVATTKQYFQYKFYNNKLYLFGDFSEVPYEILEINGRSGKKLFLFHNEVFYRIENNVTRTSRLRKVNDPELIDELLILKENKTKE